MEARPEFTQMSSSAFELWLEALKALLAIREWSQDAEELMTFLFSSEHLGEADEEDEDEGEGAGGDDGAEDEPQSLVEVAEREQAKMAKEAEAQQAAATKAMLDAAKAVSVADASEASPRY